MKKLANLIVNKKYFILSLVLIICIGCAFLIPHVEINKDLTKYLPDDSSVKAGLSVMEQEFPDNKMPGTVRVMFKELGKNKIPDVLEKLKAIPNVSGVEYDNSNKYNKSPYTLFCVKTDYDYNTPEEIAIEKAIRKEFADYDMILQHTQSTITTIPLWVIGIVLLVLIIILFIMCASYVEPFLFLATIGIAIVINLGTNIIMGSISETTFSIGAVLQLALSMDYSIILMNRYRQEKQKTADSNEAMKNAFTAAFSSIVSSGMTTVIGLLALVFMSFKIGIDLGITMAKGVACSMICVLAVLPPLILIFDKLIERTKKKELYVPMSAIAKLSYKGRKVIAAFFAVLFIAAALLQNITGITFSQLKEDKIEDIFPTSNQIVMLYENKDEHKALSIIDQIKNKENVNGVVGFVNTLGNPLTAKEMADTISGLSTDFSLDPSLLALLYYDYYSGDKVPNMTVDQFINFLSDDIMPNPNSSKYFDENVKANIEKIKIYTDKTLLTTPQTADELARLLGIDREQISLLYVYSHSADNSYNPPAMTLSTFVNFIKTDIATNPLFSSKFDKAALAALNEISPLLDKSTIQTPMPASALANAFKMEPSIVEQLFMLKFGTAENQYMSMVDFVNFLLTDADTNPMFASQFDENKVAQLNIMKAIMDAAVSDTEIGYKQMATLLSMKESDVKLLYTYRAHTRDKKALKMSMQGFVTFVVDSVLPDKNLNSAFDEKSAAQIKQSKVLIDAVISQKEYTATEMLQLIGNFTDSLDQNKIDMLYLYHAGIKHGNSSWKLSIEQLFNHLLNDILPDERFALFIDEATKATILKTKDSLTQGIERLKSKNYSLILLDTSLPLEGKQTTDFVDTLNEICDKELSGKYYIIGNSPMNVEMEKGFKKDLILITILTAIAIFTVVAFTFKSISIPLLLVLIVQCGVYLTVAFSGLIGHSMYYIALLMVQCILMGATIDYGIVYTTYYIEKRKTEDIQTAISLSYKESIHTILTSGLIIVIITGIIGISPADPSITEICQTLSIGALSAILLILFVLPGLLACFDKFIIKSKKQKQN